VSTSPEGSVSSSFDKQATVRLQSNNGNTCSNIQSQNQLYEVMEAS
jgi:hypothetical protein